MVLKRHSVLPILAAAVLLAGCAMQSRHVRIQPRDPDSKAVELFMDGILYDQDQNFAAGLLSYHEALLYDTTSPALYLAIGRDYLLMGRDESALVNLEKCIRKDPKNPEARSLAARIYLNQGQWNLAEKTYSDILAVDSTDTDACYNLALIYLKRNEQEKTATMLKRILAVSAEPNLQTVSQLARLYTEMKKYDDAMALYKRLVDIDPRGGYGYFGIGTILETRQDTSGAVAQYVQALAFSPELSDARERLGEIYIRKKEYDKAILLFSEAVQSDSTDLGSLLALAGAYEDKGDTTKAEVYFQNAQKRFSKEAQPLLDLGNFYMNRQKFGAAYREFQKVIQLDSQNFWGWLFCGVALVHMDSLKQSVPRLQRALAMIPDDPMGNYYMGTALNQLKRPNEALPYLKNALRIRSKWISVMNALAGVYDSMKEYAASDSMYQAALQIEPDNSLLLNNWSYSLCERNERLGDAFNMSIKALEKDPDNGAYLDTLGWIYFKMGDLQKAKELIEHAYRTRQASSDILDHLGEVYVKLGMKSQALEAWKKALELDPGNAGIQNKLSQASGEAR